MGAGVVQEFEAVCVYIAVPVIVVYGKIITALIQCCSGIACCRKLFGAYCCIKLGVLVSCFCDGTSWNDCADGIGTFEPETLAECKVVANGLVDSLFVVGSFIVGSYKILVGLIFKYYFVYRCGYTLPGYPYFAFYAVL